MDGPDIWLLVEANLWIWTLSIQYSRWFYELGPVSLLCCWSITGLHHTVCKVLCVFLYNTITGDSHWTKYDILYVLETFYHFTGDWWSLEPFPCCAVSGPSQTLVPTRPLDIVMFGVCCCYCSYLNGSQSQFLLSQSQIQDSKALTQHLLLHILKK